MMTSFTPTEAAALLDMPERQVRKEVEYGLFSTELNFPALVYLRALRTLGLTLGVEDRKRVFVVLVDAVQRDSPTAEVSTVVTLRVGPLVDEVRGHISRFCRWRDGLTRDRSVLGGEPVFPKSRLSVRHIGGMLERGAPPAEIKEDYPYLSDEDLEFAVLFVRAYPRVGRPRETRQTSDR